MLSLCLQILGYSAFHTITISVIPRHPNKSLRPSFRDIVLALTGKMEDILEIPENDEDITPQFKNLGADLEAGEHVYMDLQTSY